MSKDEEPCLGELHPILGWLTPIHLGYLDDLKVEAQKKLLMSMKIVVEDGEHVFPTDIVSHSLHTDGDDKVSYVVYVRKRSDKR